KRGPPPPPPPHKHKQTPTHIHTPTSQKHTHKHPHNNHTTSPLPPHTHTQCINSKQKSLTRFNPLQTGAGNKSGQTAQHLCDDSHSKQHLHRKSSWMLLMCFAEKRPTAGPQVARTRHRFHSTVN